MRSIVLVVPLAVVVQPTPAESSQAPVRGGSSTRTTVQHICVSWCADYAAVFTCWR